MSLFSRFRRRKWFQKQEVPSAQPAVKIEPEKKPEKPFVRWLIRQDIPEVLAIENTSFASAWTESDFLGVLRKRNSIGMAAVHGDRVVGVITYELDRKCLRITNFAVDPDFRNQGIGRMMMQKMLEKIGRRQRDHIVILLPDDCAHARAFFLKCGGGVTRIQTTDTKGLVGVAVIIKRMKSKHVVRVQMIEDECIVKDPRNIASMLGHGTQGAIAVNTRGVDGNEIIGYILWEEDYASIVVNGAVGQITHPDYLHRGAGRALMRHIAARGKPVVVSGIDLKDKDRCQFLRDIGVPVPELARYMTIEWKPESTL